MQLPILKVDQLGYDVLLGQEKHTILDKISFGVKKGEIVGIAGESGCGKSTLARCIVQLHQIQRGKVYFDGLEISNPRIYQKNKKEITKKCQLLLQQAESSLNPQLPVWKCICEPAMIAKIIRKKREWIAQAEGWLEQLGLDASYSLRYPYEMSGGQRQRVAIARALMTQPQLLILDEGVAGLDLSVQALVVNLLQQQVRQNKMTLVWIGHDLALMHYLCDRIGVLYQGRLVELAPADQLMKNPQHEYTKMLLSCIPVPDPIVQRERVPVFLENFSPCKQDRWTEIQPEHFMLQ